MKKLLTVFAAEKAVWLEGVLFFLAAFRMDTLYGALFFLLSGTFLLLFSVVIARSLKWFIKKKRPEDSQASTESIHAFPSGHATGLAVISGYILYVDMTLGVISLFLAFVIAYARIKARMHDIFDIVAGFFLGGLFVYVCPPLV